MDGCMWIRWVDTIVDQLVLVKFQADLVAFLHTLAKLNKKDSRTTFFQKSMFYDSKNNVPERSPHCFRSPILARLADLGCYFGPSWIPKIILAKSRKEVVQNREPKKHRIPIEVWYPNERFGKQKQAFRIIYTAKQSLETIYCQKGSPETIKIGANNVPGSDSLNLRAFLSHPRKGDQKSQK